MTPEHIAQVVLLLEAIYTAMVMLSYCTCTTCCSCVSSITFLNRNEITVQEEAAEIMISFYTMWLSESHSEGVSAHIEIITMIYIYTIQCNELR